MIFSFVFLRERELQPRFIPPGSFEFQLAQKWRDLYLEEQEKKASLDRELEELRYNLELEMESASREQDAMKIREGIIINGLIIDKFLLPFLLVRFGSLYYYNMIQITINLISCVQNLT